MILKLIFYRRMTLPADRQCETTATSLRVRQNADPLALQLIKRLNVAAARAGGENRSFRLKESDKKTQQKRGVGWEGGGGRSPVQGVQEGD